jgi:site-specific DNA recombinase
MEQKIQKIGIYARQSRDKETTGSIDDQVYQGTLKAKELGLEYEVYIDRGESAAYDTLTNRPDFLRLLADIESKVITAVFVYDESRLTRNQKTKLLIKSVFIEHNVKVYTKIEGTIDFNDSDNEFISDMRTLFASKYVKDTSRKIKGVLRNRAAQGKAHTGILKPFGYTADENKNLVVDEEEAAIVKQIFQLSLRGFGSGRIAEKLNADGIQSKGRKLLKNGITVSDKFSGKKKHIANEHLVWAGNTVLSMLKNTIYKGERKYKNEIFGAPAIIDPETWTKAQLQIAKNKKQTGKVKFQYLLRGICICGRCGSNFVGRTRENKKDHYYYCSSKIQKHKRCGIRSINIDYLDELLWGIVTNSGAVVPFALKQVDNLKSPQSIKVLDFQRAQLNKKLTELQKHKEKLITLFKKDLISEEEVERDLKNIKELQSKHKLDLSIVESQLFEHENLKGIFNEMAVFQNQLKSIGNTIDYDLKHSLIRSLVDNVVINYNEDDEIYTIDVRLKVFDFIDEHTFYLSKNKHEIIENKSSPGLFTSGLPEYSAYSNHTVPIDDSSLRPCKNNNKKFTSIIPESQINKNPYPPSSTPLPTWHLWAAG